MPFDFQPYFNRFVGDLLPLDQARIDRVSGAYSRLSALVGNDTAFDRFRPEVVVQVPTRLEQRLGPFDHPMTSMSM